jgi:hydroxyacylglutathione hydrolase
VQLWPGHGAGSACGKALGAVPQSTLGYERLFNWGLRAEDEQAFVDEVLAGQPEPPKYFAEMKRINKEGPRVLDGFTLPQRQSDARLAELVEAGAIVVDTRRAADFAAGHVPGTINIPLNRAFNTWAGWLVPYDRDFHLIVDDARHGLDEAVRDLAMIGLDRLAGYFGVEVIDTWKAQGRPLQELGHVGLDRLDELSRNGDATVLDVRGRSEWDAGHLPGVENVFVGALPDRIDELPRDRPVVVHCESGSRSAIAASVLQAHGFDEVYDAPGFVDWVAAGKPIERDPASQPAGAA